MTAERERDNLLEQLALRSECAMAKDNQEIMRINNEIVAERDALRKRLAEAEAALPADLSEPEFVLQPDAGGAR